MAANKSGKCAPIGSIDPGLKTWATDRQCEYIDAVNHHGSMNKAAKALGVRRENIVRSMQTLRTTAASRGYAPDHDMVRTVPAPFLVKGVSTYYDKDGKASGQWVKSQIDHEQREAYIRSAIGALVEECRGMAPLIEPPKASLGKLLAVYPMGDPHFGLYAWAKEVGDDFDLAIARRVTQGAIDRLVGAAPAAETAILLPLGDVLHINDQTNLTPGHKNQLDADGRFVKVVQVCIHAYRHAVLRLLEKHQKVIVRFVGGNHDPTSIWALAFAIDAYFHSDPRVEVDLSPAAHWFYRFGLVLIGATHGDKTKPDQLLGVMATDRARDWGETKYRYWYTGHVHHQVVREFSGVTQESFRTLAVNDSFGSSHGYRAGRDMRLIVHHADYGEIERHRCDIGMIE